MCFRGHNGINRHGIIMFAIHWKIRKNIKTKINKHSKILRISESKRHISAHTISLRLLYMSEVSKVDRSDNFESLVSLKTIEIL